MIIIIIIIISDNNNNNISNNSAKQIDQPAIWISLRGVPESQEPVVHKWQD